LDPNSSPRKLDIVAPVLNEEIGVGEFLRKLESDLLDLMSAWDLNIILVDDGSDDGTVTKALQVSQTTSIPLTVISLSRNFGHQVALHVGIQNSRPGSCVAAIDADLQDPPAVLVEVLSKLSEYEVVVTKRLSRKDKISKKVPAWLFYRLIGVLSNQKVAEDSGDFWALAEAPAEVVRSKISEKSLFMRALVRDLGFSVFELGFHRHERFAGFGKFTVSKMLKLATSALMHFSVAPIRLSIVFVLISLFWGIAGLTFMVLGRVFGFADFSPGLVAFAAFLLPLVLTLNFSVSIVVVYLGKVLDEVRGRPNHIISKIHKSDPKK
jgi:polyisoprenyl-phosphate glycosyltransferase